MNKKENETAIAIVNVLNQSVVGWRHPSYIGKSRFISQKTRTEKLTRKWYGKLRECSFHVWIKCLIGREIAASKKIHPKDVPPNSK